MRGLVWNYNSNSVGSERGTNPGRMDEGSRLLAQAIIGDIEMMRKTQPAGQMSSIIENLFSLTVINRMVPAFTPALPLYPPVSTAIHRCVHPNLRHLYPMSSTQPSNSTRQSGS